jgi:hypothetical protein
MSEFPILTDQKIDRSVSLAATSASPFPAPNASTEAMLSPPLHLAICTMAKLLDEQAARVAITTSGREVQ